MVRLIPMTATDFQVYLEEDTKRYAQERVRVGDWHPTDALQKSREEHQQLLPDGIATKNHYLFSEFRGDHASSPTLSPTRGRSSFDSAA